jgi:hypothetical protein
MDCYELVEGGTGVNRTARYMRGWIGLDGLDWMDGRGWMGEWEEEGGIADYTIYM